MASALIEEIKSTGQKLISNDAVDFYYKDGVGSCYIVKENGVENDVFVKKF